MPLVSHVDWGFLAVISDLLLITDRNQKYLTMIYEMHCSLSLKDAKTGCEMQNKICGECCIYLHQP